MERHTVKRFVLMSKLMIVFIRCVCLFDGCAKYLMLGDWRRWKWWVFLWRWVLYSDTHHTLLTNETHEYVCVGGNIWFELLSKHNIQWSWRGYEMWEFTVYVFEGYGVQLLKYYFYFVYVVLRCCYTWRETRQKTGYFFHHLHWIRHMRGHHEQEWWREVTHGTNEGKCG